MPETASTAVPRPSRRDILTPERILAIAIERGEFSVSARWRDEWLLRRCGRLVRAGRLRRVRAEAEGAYHFAAVPAERESDR